MSVRADPSRLALRVAATRIAAAARVAAAALLAAAAATPATAAPVERTRPTAVESMAKVPVDDQRPTVRCWQYGRLVYEASNVQLVREAGAESGPSASEPSAGASAPAAKGQRRVRVLDLHQGLCIVE